jgi:hypothetical protein
MPLLVDCDNLERFPCRLHHPLAQGRVHVPQNAADTEGPAEACLN